MQRLQIEEARRVYVDQRQGIQTLQRCTLDGDTKGNERIINNATAIPLRQVRVWAVDFQVLQVWNLLEHANERWDVRRSMEERRVLLDEHVRHLPRSVLGLFDLADNSGRLMDLRRVDKVFLRAGHRIDKRRKDSLCRMRHVERKGPDMLADAL